MKVISKSIFALLAVAVVFNNIAVAEDINEIFKKVNQFIEKENYSKAIEELAWANKELEKLHNKKLATLLPDEIEGYQGQKIEQQSAIGISSISRKYKKDGDQIELNIAGGGKGGMAGIGKMAAMFGGNQPGVETFRLDGLTANLNTSSRRPELTVFLESGSILSLKKRKKGEDPEETLKSFAKALKIGELDKYLKGDI